MVVCFFVGLVFACDLRVGWLGLIMCLISCGFWIVIVFLCGMWLAVA